jgi:tRNA pseudouridine38-40 synthase
MRLKLLLAYVGTQYRGWQIQQIPQAPPTIQGTLEAALQKIAGQMLRVHGAGRTDSGVHAHAQVAHVDIPEARARLNWQRSLNAILPDDIRIISVESVPDSFHARKDALHKTYIYQFWQERSFLPPQLAPFVWNCGPLEGEAMRAALPHLLGRHDFSGLCNRGTDVQSRVRTVLDARLYTLPPCEYYPAHAPVLRFSVTANGFLKQMVRNMAGLLAACGRGKIQPEAIPALLASKSRQAMPAPTAPAQGLALTHIHYPTDQLADTPAEKIEKPLQTRQEQSTAGR